MQQRCTLCWYGIFCRLCREKSHTSSIISGQGFMIPGSTSLLWLIVLAIALMTQSAHVPTVRLCALRCASPWVSRVGGVWHSWSLRVYLTLWLPSAAIYGPERGWAGNDPSTQRWRNGNADKVMDGATSKTSDFLVFGTWKKNKTQIQRKMFLLLFQEELTFIRWVSHIMNGLTVQMPWKLLAAAGTKTSVRHMWEDVEMWPCTQVSTFWVCHSVFKCLCETQRPTDTVYGM